MFLGVRERMHWLICSKLIFQTADKVVLKGNHENLSTKPKFVQSWQ